MAEIISWAVYEVDVCTSIAYLWDPGFDMNTIMTPLPRNLEDYALVSRTKDHQSMLISHSRASFRTRMISAYLSFWTTRIMTPAGLTGLSTASYRFESSRPRIYAKQLA